MVWLIVSVCQQVRERLGNKIKKKKAWTSVNCKVHVSARSTFCDVTKGAATPLNTGGCKQRGSIVNVREFRALSRCSSMLPC